MEVINNAKACKTFPLRDIGPGKLIQIEGVTGYYITTRYVGGKTSWKQVNGVCDCVNIDTGLVTVFSNTTSCIVLAANVVISGVE